MKLAEALIERKALKEKLVRLRQRLAENARVQEGDQPQEEPRELLREVEETLAALQKLIVQINRTNIATSLAEGGPATLTEAIAERDILSLKREILQQVVNAATITRERGFALTRSEIKFRATLDVAALQKDIDANAKAYRELDAQIQARNFAADLRE